ncbi:hypothetical protein BEL04_03325 [Mucilaginibacter sp. PPCGB 2223]|uniref:hypothetical protein n=1 Tax=Mucilaginibacter sp. PPCGB 2223 TaxID=1886027 RepID=UPI0008262E5B|nr:hypothetical protein [Mucilaginibacter sp. PPCGB 2223]OCX53344.1 hypothetical protein BEL04_03325 [Mucilaginibacter sp. PPCGB 2223]
MCQKGIKNEKSALLAQKLRKALKIIKIPKNTYVLKAGSAGLKARGVMTYLKMPTISPMLS